MPSCSSVRQPDARRGLPRIGGGVPHRSLSRQVQALVLRGPDEVGDVPAGRVPRHPRHRIAAKAARRDDVLEPPALSEAARETMMAVRDAALTDNVPAMSDFRGTLPRQGTAHRVRSQPGAQPGADPVRRIPLGGSLRRPGSCWRSRPATAGIRRLTSSWYRPAMARSSAGGGRRHLRARPRGRRPAECDGRSAEDVATRFLACGWNVTRVGDANDLEMLDRAFETFRHTHDRPTLIIVDSHIAYGAPTKQDTSAAHGEPLGDDEIRRTKRVYGWPEEAKKTGRRGWGGPIIAGSAAPRAQTGGCCGDRSRSAAAAGGPGARG